MKGAPSAIKIYRVVGLRSFPALFGIVVLPAPATPSSPQLSGGATFTRHIAACLLESSNSHCNMKFTSAFITSTILFWQIADAIISQQRGYCCRLSLCSIYASYTIKVFMQRIVVPLCFVVQFLKPYLKNNLVIKHYIGFIYLG